MSAIINPFLYGYFNETFKDGLENIFLLCCRSMKKNTTKFTIIKQIFPHLNSLVKLLIKRVRLVSMNTRITRMTIGEISCVFVPICVL